MAAENFCTVADARTLLGHQIDLLAAYPDLAGLIAPIMLWGPPGVGKSSVVRELCYEKSIGFVDVRLSQREPIDLRGLPVPRGDTVEWLLSSEWPRAPESRGILLFDELTSADRSLQVAAYELILDRRLGTLYSLPPGWLVVAAGNRVQDRALAGTLSSALANRFCHLDIEPDCTEWLAWAASKGINPLVMGYLRFRPSMFFDMSSGDLQRGWPSARSWERVSIALEHAGTLPAALLDRQIEGLVGCAAAGEFNEFRALARELPDVPAMLTGAAPCTMPSRSDLRYALCSAVAHHFWHLAPLPTAVNRLYELLLSLPPDFATLLLTDVLRAGNAEGISELFRHPEFISVQRKLGPSLTGRINMATHSRVAAILREAELERSF